MPAANNSQDILIPISSQPSFASVSPSSEPTAIQPIRVLPRGAPEDEFLSTRPKIFSARRVTDQPTMKVAEKITRRNEELLDLLSIANMITEQMKDDHIQQIQKNLTPAYFVEIGRAHV